VVECLGFEPAPLVPELVGPVFNWEALADSAAGFALDWGGCDVGETGGPVGDGEGYRGGEAGG